MGVAVPRGEGVLVPTAKLLRGEQGWKGWQRSRALTTLQAREERCGFAHGKGLTWLHFEITNVPLSETDLTKIKMKGT